MRTAFIILALSTTVLAVSLFALALRLTDLEQRTEIEFARLRYWNVQQALKLVLSCDKTDRENFLAGLRAGVTVELITWRATHCPPEGR